MILLIFLTLLDVNALEYKCEYAIYPPGILSLNSMDKFQNLNLEEGDSLKSSLNHSINKYFYKENSTNKEFSIFTLNEPSSIKLPNGCSFVKNEKVGNFKLTLERVSAEEAYMSYEITDKGGTRKKKFDEEIVDQKKSVTVNLNLDSLNPITRINCRFVSQLIIDQSQSIKESKESENKTNPAHSTQQ
jgi:hypothetical protein